MSHPSNGTTDSQWNRAGLATSERHDLLSSERRRRTLDALAQRSTDVELETLAADVAARAPGVEAVDEERVGRVALTLHHSHLPRLDDAGVVDYDPERHVVTPDAGSIDSLGTRHARF